MRYTNWHLYLLKHLHLFKRQCIWNNWKKWEWNIAPDGHVYTQFSPWWTENNIRFAFIPIHLCGRKITLSQNNLLQVFYVARHTHTYIYALPAWGGFLSNDLIAKLDAFFSCDLRRLSVLLNKADEHLFHKMVNNKDHCIHQLLPPENILPMKLRATDCIFALPQCLSLIHIWRCRRRG